MEQKKNYLTALTIAGSDSGGGAGIQADLKTFSSLGVYGASVITAITAQNTLQVRAVEALSPEMVRQQLESVLDDIPIHAVKTGMLPTREIVEVVAQIADKYRLPLLVADPVMVSTSGSKLVSGDIGHAFRELLYERSVVLTPNIPEASCLSGIEIRNESDLYRAGETLLAQGCRAVLIKGGHLRGRLSTDILFTQCHPPRTFSTEFIVSDNLHGTGCTLSSAIAAGLAMGQALAEAVETAKSYVTQAIRAGRDVQTGQGKGPLNHFFDPQPMIMINPNTNN
jgi:hydroxymethylpyrimidine/phosphomethylpyrimidine kinase